jgi:hypothetical protein
MKNLLYLCLIFAFISCNGNSETKTAESSNVEENTTSSETEIVTENSPTDTNQEKAETKELETVEDIREEYQTIQFKITNGKMDSSSFNYECDGGLGQVVFFSENGQLRKVRYGNGYEHGGVIKEYFLKDNAPFFVFHDASTWTFDVGTNKEGATRDDMIESRFYIIDGKLIKCLEKKFTIRSSVKNNPTSATVQNKEVACSDLTELLKDYNLVLKYKNQTTDMECLEE